MKDQIKKVLQTRWAGQEVFYYSQTDSTNIQAKRYAKEGGEAGSLFVAEHQTHGRGRRGHTWISPYAENIYFSLLLRPDTQPERIPMLTLVMAYSVRQAIAKEVNLISQIKWPNDLVINGKKICGILTEMGEDGHNARYVVIGVGINTNMEAFPPALQRIATSLKNEGKKEVNRASLIAEILQSFEEHYEVVLRDGSLKSIYSSYNEYLVNAGKEVCVSGSTGEYRGYAKGINEKGELLVKKEDGTIVSVFGGEVSVRGVYGYV